MEDNLDTTNDEFVIEDIDQSTLTTLDETLEQDISEAKVDPKKIDGEDDDDKEDDGEGMDDLGDEDSDVDNDGDSDNADEYLKNRRKTVAKKIAKEDTDIDDSYASEDINRLIESEENLTEEFKDKAAIIFEAAVSSKVNEIEESLQEQYDLRLSEEIESVKSTLEEQVDNYLTYAVETWMEENKVAIESSLRTQLAENFISALKNVFVENYVDVPDSKVDMFAQLEAENSNLKEEAEKLNRISETLANRVDTLVREQILAEASNGLADTQVDKLKKLVEDVEFIDEATYRKKVATVKEFYFNDSNQTENTLNEDVDDNSYISTETIVEGEDIDNNISPEMKSYLTALSRMNSAVTADLH